MTTLRSEDRTLALHAIKDGDGLPLLLLHGMRESSESWRARAEDLAHWPGPIHALDFSGHGESAWRRGGFYSPEYLASDADIALARLERAALCGAGLGAYVALLLAGARPDAVPAALLLPGSGLEGGGDEPDFGVSVDPWRDVPLGSHVEAGNAACDPMLSFLDHELRPLDYAGEFARAANALLLPSLETAPGWWRAAEDAAGSSVAASDLARAIAELLHRSSG